MVVSPSMIYNASAKGIRIDEVESILECDPDVRGSMGLDEIVGNGYQKINVAFRIRADTCQTKS